MNVYEKLQQARVDLQNLTIKKSGKNKFADYTYYELGDFLPHINLLMKEHKLTSSLRYDKEIAQLDIIDSEKPEDKIPFSCPMSSASLKGCHEVQNMGAAITYIRRYLYMNAFEIVEHDALDATQDDATQEKKPPATSHERGYALPEQVMEIESRTSGEQRAALARKYKVSSLAKLSYADANRVIDQLIARDQKESA